MVPPTMPERRGPHGGMPAPAGHGALHPARWQQRLLIAVAWAVALQNQNKPTALLLSRQNLPYAPKRDLGDISRGAYVLSEPADVGLKKKAQAVIIATGSEVQLALKAQEQLAAQKIAVRVVSMPSTTTFDKQTMAYKASVLPAGVPRVAVEMGRDPLLDVGEANRIEAVERAELPRRIPPGLGHRRELLDLGPIDRAAAARRVA